MDVAITKMSTKGQIVIPVEMRAGFEVGEKLLVIRSQDSVIIKKASRLEKQFKEDLEFARRTEAALERYEKGEHKGMSFETLKKEIKKW